LARRGDEGQLAVLVHAASEAVHPSVRGEAVRLLGEFDAARHFPILNTALLDDHETCDGHYAPAGEEAALALARLGTPEALTAMLRAYFATPNYIVWRCVGEYLRTLATSGDQNEPVSMISWNSCRVALRSLFRT
jgi:HEAT repeat protein